MVVTSFEHLFLSSSSSFRPVSLKPSGGLEKGTLNLLLPKVTLCNASYLSLHLLMWVQCSLACWAGGSNCGCKLSPKYITLRGLIWPRTGRALIVLSPSLSVFSNSFFQSSLGLYVCACVRVCVCVCVCVGVYVCVKYFIFYEKRV